VADGFDDSVTDVCVLSEDDEVSGRVLIWTKSAREVAIGPSVMVMWFDAEVSDSGVVHGDLVGRNAAVVAHAIPETITSGSMSNGWASSGSKMSLSIGKRG
jgi:hypothetical protein